MELWELLVLTGSALNLLALVLALVFRKLLLRALGRLLFEGAIEFARAEFFEEGIQVGEDGKKRPYVVLRPSGEALLGKYLPPLLAFALKSFKFKLPAGGGGLPPGLDLSKLGEALPQLIMAMPGKNLNLGGFRLPKEVAAALSSIFGPAIQGFVGGKPGAKKTESTEEIGKIV